MTWQSQLAELSSVPVCVLGIGNRQRGDDAVGPLVCDRLCDRLGDRFAGTTIDAGIAPENYLERVVASSARLVLIVDAADFGGAPGEVRVLAPEALAGTGVSTHACSPAMLSEYLSARSAAPPTVAWLVVQPQSTQTDGPSPAVARSVDALAKQLCALWPAENRS